jgi:putative flavoprotein involved in K+ transport
LRREQVEDLHHVLGLSWQHTRGSALLGWVGGDAAFLAEQIAPTRDGRMERKSRPRFGA